MSDSVDRVTAALADRYAVEQELGSGGMATVYLAEDLKHHRKVAVKVLRPELAAAVGAERFLREIETTARLNHPHILPLLDSGAAGGLLYYVMPYMTGESLADRLERETQLPVLDATQITREVASALTYAHEHDVVHRDIKPDNILLEAGIAVVADFGIARALTPAPGARITETGLAVGTPSYMSPEQSAGSDQLDGRSDVYALACVAYEMLAGQPPFSGPTAQAVLSQHATAAPPALQSIRNTVPSHIEDAITRALQKTPADRFPSAVAFAEALDRPSASSALPTSAVRRAVKLGVPAAAIAVGAVLGVLAVQTLGTDPSLQAGLPKLAVLPFENPSAPDDEFFADGITEEITSRLAGISGFRTVSRQSAKRFKGSIATIQQIGDSLGVDYVLAGTVRTDRGQGGIGEVRVTTQLIRVSDDTHLWAAPYTASLAPGEIFAVQAEIAEGVATALNVTLLAPERETVRAVDTEDPEAHDLYLLGRFLMEKRDPQSLARARELFAEAIARDPSYAHAHAGLADAISLSIFFGGRERGSAAWAEAEAPARRAVALDSNLGKAHAALGLTLMYGKWDWEGARRAYERAMELDPNDAVVRYWSVEILWAERRSEEALARAEEAVALDPFSAVAANLAGTSLWNLGRVAEGIAAVERAVELQPTLSLSHMQLAWMYAKEGLQEEALDAIRSFFLHLDPNRPISDDFANRLIDVYVGRADVTATAEVVRESASYGLKNTMAAMAFALSGHADSAFARLDLAIERRNEWLPVFMDRIDRFLEDDPRWDTVLERMGLE